MNAHIPISKSYNFLDSTARNNAKYVLKLYFQTLAARCGMPWSGDNDAEIEDMVDNIIEATITEINERMAKNE